MKNKHSTINLKKIPLTIELNFKLQDIRFLQINIFMLQIFESSIFKLKTHVFLEG